MPLYFFKGGYKMREATKGTLSKKNKYYISKILLYPLAKFTNVLMKRVRCA